MDASHLRKKLQSYLEVVDVKKLRAIYTIMEVEIEEHFTEYDENLKSELDSRYNSFKNGKAKLITAGESKKRINKLLSKR